jgi:hypothetical protein
MIWNSASVQVADNYDCPVKIFFQCPLFTVLLTKCKISPHTEHLPSESAIRWEDFSAFWHHGSRSTYQNRSFFTCESRSVSACRNSSIFTCPRKVLTCQSRSVPACRNRSVFYLRVQVNVYLPEQVIFYLQSTSVSAWTDQFLLAQGKFLPVILGQCLSAGTVNFYLPKIRFYLLV